MAMGCVCVCVAGQYVYVADVNDYVGVGAHKIVVFTIEGDYVTSIVASIVLVCVLTKMGLCMPLYVLSLR